MNSQSAPVTDPFKLVGEYTPNAPKTLPTIKAAPERGKVSATATGKVKKPRVRKVKATKQADPTHASALDAIQFVASLDAAEYELFKAEMDKETAATRPTLTAAETEMLASLRSFPEPRKEAAMKLINHLAQQAEHPTEETPVVTLDPEPEPTPAPEAEPTEDDELDALPTWGSNSVRRFEPEAMALIPQAIQTLSLLMSDGLMSFYDKELNGEDWCDAFGMAVHTVAHAMARVRTGSLIVDVHAWGKSWR